MLAGWRCQCLYFWCLHKHLLIKHATNAFFSWWWELVWDLFRDDSKVFYLCGHLSAKPGLLLSSKHDSKWNFRSSVIRTTKWGSAGASLHPCHAPSICRVTCPSPSSQFYILEKSSLKAFPVDLQLHCLFLFLIKGKRNNPVLPFSTPSFGSSDSCNSKWKTSHLPNTTMQDIPGCPSPAFLVHETWVTLVRKSLGLVKVS